MNVEFDVFDGSLTVEERCKKATTFLQAVDEDKVDRERFPPYIQRLIPSIFVPSGDQKRSDISKTLFRGDGVPRASHPPSAPSSIRISRLEIYLIILFLFYLVSCALFVPDRSGLFKPIRPNHPTRSADNAILTLKINI